jgi:hypothetical protein
MPRKETECRYELEHRRRSFCVRGLLQLVGNRVRAHFLCYDLLFHCSVKRLPIPYDLSHSLLCTKVVIASLSRISIRPRSLVLLSLPLSHVQFLKVLCYYHGCQLRCCCSFAVDLVFLAAGPVRMVMRQHCLLQNARHCVAQQQSTTSRRVRIRRTIIRRAVATPFPFVVCREVCQGHGRAVLCRNECQFFQDRFDCRSRCLM